VLDVAAAASFRAENRWAIKARGMTAAALMSTPVHTVRLDDLVRLAAARLVTMGVKRLPVVDADGRLVGIVSRSDVLRLFHRTDRLVRIDIERLLRDPLSVPDDHEISADVHDGIVTLAGRVSVASHRRLIEAVVREVPGVIDVQSDDVAVAPASTIVAG
jgi:CBS domain-containing protein